MKLLFRIILSILLILIPQKVVINAHVLPDSLYLKSGVGMSFFWKNEAFNINNTSKTKYDRSTYNFYFPMLYLGYNINQYFNSGIFLFNSWSVNQALSYSATLEESLNSKYVSSYMNLDLNQILPNTEKYQQLRKIFDEQKIANVIFDFSSLVIAPFVNFNFLNKNKFTFSISGYGGINIMHGIKSSVNYGFKDFFSQIDTDNNTKSEFKSWIQNEENTQKRNTSIDPKHRNSIKLSNHLQEELMIYFYNEIVLNTDKETEISRNYGDKINFTTNFRKKLVPCFGINVGSSWNFSSNWEASILAQVNFLGNLSELSIDNVEGNLNTQKIFFNTQNADHKITLGSNYLISIGLSSEIKCNF